MLRPKVSVVVPVYNVEKYLKRCLDSIISQTLKDIEIILVDDGSKDQSGQICDEIKTTDNRIKVIHQSNGGLGFARNSGLKIATGEYISFVDSDDYIKLDMYEKLYVNAKNNNSDTCIFGYFRIRDEKIFYTRTSSIAGTFRGQEEFNNIFLNVLGTEPSSYNDFRILWQSAWLSLYSLDLIRKYNISFPSTGEFVTFSEDTLFNLDYYYHASNVTVVNEPFYYYCENQNTITTKYNEKRFALNVSLFKEQLLRAKNYIKDEELYKKAEERMQRTFLAAARNCIMFISAFFSYKEGRSRILEICNSSVLHEVLHIYPWHKNPLKYRLFNYGLTKKRLWFLYILGKFKK